MLPTFVQLLALLHGLAFLLAGAIIWTDIRRLRPPGENALGFRRLAGFSLLHGGAGLILALDPTASRLILALPALLLEAGGFWLLLDYALIREAPPTPPWRRYAPHLLTAVGLAGLLVLAGGVIDAAMAIGWIYLIPGLAAGLATAHALRREGDFATPYPAINQARNGLRRLLPFYAVGLALAYWLPPLATLPFLALLGAAFAFSLTQMADLLRLEDHGRRETACRERENHRQTAAALAARPEEKAQQVLAKGRELLVRVESEEELLDKVCQLARETGEYPLVWIGLPGESPDGAVHPAAWSGAGYADLEALAAVWTEFPEESNHRPMEKTAAACLPTAGAISQEPSFAAWREEAQRQGLAASALLPLSKKEGGALGVLAVFSEDPRAFEGEAMRPLYHLAHDMGYRLSALRQAEGRRQTAEKNEHIHQSRSAINALLRSVLEPHSLEEQLKLALDLILAIPWLSLQARGSIFLTDPETGHLEMAVQRGLDERLLDLCHSIPSGHCLCGRALATRKVVFADCLDERHDVHFDGMTEHGHYCIPIISRKDVLGVINLYLPHGHGHDPEEEDALLAIAHTLAGLIVRSRMDRDLVLAREEAEAGDKAKMEFLAVMSHEIRTPMNAVIGMADLLESSRLSRDQRDQVKVIREAGHALLDIINDILDLSKAESGALEPDPHPFLLDGLISSARDVVGFRAREKELTLATEIANGVPKALLGDAEMIRQILINLLGNAVKFTDKGSVTLLVEPLFPPDEEGVRVDDSLVFTVVDTGIGIPPDKLGMVFQAFTQADSSHSRRHGGTGLGLTICRRFSERLGGSINVESKPGQGSRFRVILPLPTAPLETAPKPEERPLPAPSTPPILGEPDILLVEDDPVNRTVLQGMLDAQGVHVFTAENGEEALRRLRHTRFDLILMDCQMPVMDGFTATRILREMEMESAEDEPTPVIAVTAYALPGDRERCLAAGMNDYLAKPVRRESLVAVLNHWLPGHLNLPPPPEPPTAPEPDLLPDLSDREEAYADKLRTPTLNRTDLENLRTLLGGRLAENVVNTFLKGLPGHLAAIRQAAKAKDLAALHKSIHPLRGASRQIGAMRFHQLLTKLDDQARGGSLKGAKKAISRLSKEADRIQRAIQVRERG